MAEPASDPSPEPASDPSPEPALRALEAALRLPVTVVDNAHFFDRQRIFSRVRRSHRKNPACEAGFDERCIRHCRYAMNRRCLGEPGPFPACCWKGLVQWVAPLRDGKVHYGMLYAGLWRSGPPPETLPEACRPERERLPEYPGDDPGLAALLELAADGLVARLRKARNLDAPPDERGARIAAFLRDNADRPVRFPELAAHLGLSRSRAGFEIRRLFGRSFTELLNAERIERAKGLLAGTRLTLRPIAGLCGFCDEFHLSRVFKRHTGFTPGEFRARNR